MPKKISIKKWYNENKDLYLQSGDVLLPDVLDLFLTYIPKGGSIIDMGCGAGRDVDYFSKKGYQATGIDISDEMIKHAKENFQGIFLVDNIISTKQANNSFDAVWSSSSLFTHLDKKDRTQALREVVRLLKPNGVFGFIVMKKEERPIPPKPILFCRFSEEEIENEISEQGFTTQSQKLISFRTREWIVCFAKFI